MWQLLLGKNITRKKLSLTWVDQSGYSLIVADQGNGCSVFSSPNVIRINLTHGWCGGSCRKQDSRIGLIKSTTIEYMYSHDYSCKSYTFPDLPMYNPPPQWKYASSKLPSHWYLTSLGMRKWMVRRPMMICTLNPFWVSWGEALHRPHDPQITDGHASDTS